MKPGCVNTLPAVNGFDRVGTSWGTVQMLDSAVASQGYFGLLIGDQLILDVTLQAQAGKHHIGL